MRKCSGLLLILTLTVVLLLLSPTPSPAPPPTTAATGPVAHLLPFLPGLSDLYPPHANSTAQLSWGLLRPLLCRSDALPGTATGILEAADAWRNLTLAVAAAAAADEGRAQGPSCPASVEGDLGAGRAGIPCGLAGGAAMTVVSMDGAILDLLRRIKSPSLLQAACSSSHASSVTGRGVRTRGLRGPSRCRHLGGTRAPRRQP
jgi:hypothetical protein